MNKKLIQELVNDDETREQISIAFGLAVDASFDQLYDGIMINVLNKLNDTLVQGDMITIEVSYHMWVRGEYVRTEPDGKLEVAIQRPPGIYEGKRVDLVVKDHEGETT